ncbi:hypothetical protein EWM64_g2415 [Hericium alpestre]|uniref:Dynamin-binding protein n=1 Tax=Hericium alpestre TaxID=135208 RepID=A0A4Z0A3K3_9AGAM|nr:hypothetical protein EWM64_g2415 [Hericium alpestre]
MGDVNRSLNRQSVGWVEGLASDFGASREPSGLATTMEEDETEDNGHADPGSGASAVPNIHVQGAEESDPLDDVDKSIEHRVRSLYAYEGQRAEELSFGENLVLTAHPSKSGSDWWYGTLVRDGKSGFFPKTYVQNLEAVKAKALYAYTGEGSDQLPFAPDDILSIVDRSESDWWKAEKEGVVFIVPAAYLEVEEDTDEEQPTEEQRKQEREARAAERQKVLEAAGLVLKQDGRKPPPRPMKRGNAFMAGKKKHRPPPAIPIQKQSSGTSDGAEKELAALADSTAASNDDVMRLDDAFDRYEEFKKSSVENNRWSVSSLESSPIPSSPSASLTPSKSTDRNEGSEGRYSTLLHHFLGRSRTPVEGEKKVMPTISAPIMNGETSLISRESSIGPGFGSSWASLVDKSALEGMPARERSRQEAIFELIATETAYVRDLQLIVGVFYSSMLDILEPKAIAVVFANVEDLLLTNTTFLSVLEERQRACRLYVDHIGDILDENMMKMQIYREYCVNQANASTVLQSLRKKNPALASHLQKLRDDPSTRNLDLSSFLLVPMQRVTRYPLLIKQILHYTEPDQDRAEIERALRTAEKILRHINEAIREQEGYQRLRALSQDLWIGHGRLDLTAPTRSMGDRKLIREGPISKLKSGKKLYAFLCSDILVLTDENAKALYRMPIPLGEIQVSEINGGRDDLAFALHLAYPRGGDKIGLRAPSARDCHMWMADIDIASRKCREADRRAAQRANRNSRQ